MAEYGETSAPRGWPAGGDEMAARIRAHDWAATPLGPIGGWPPSLRTAVDLCLAWPEPASVLWGPRHIQLYNSAYARTPRVRHPAMLGRPLLANWPAERDLLAAALARLAADGAPLESPDHAVAGAGPGDPEERFYTLSFAAIRDESGALGGVFHRAIETTARVAADRRRDAATAALRASEERFREFGAASSDLLWIRDAATMRLAYLSPAFAALYGADPAAVAGDGDLARWAALLHPDDRARALANLARARAGARVAHEFRVVHPADGATRWLRDTTFPFGGASGRARWIGGIARDITDERRAAEALRASEERARLAVEVAELATWDWDLPTDTVRWNDRHFALLGLPPRGGTVPPAAFFAHVHPADRARVAAALERAVAARAPFDEEFRAVRADGETRWMAGHGRATAEAGGRATRMGGVMGDITDRKRAEADRERLLAAEREARALAEATVRGRDQFLATAAHELRAPLARLRLGAQLIQLAGALGAAEREEALTIVERGSQRLEVLVRDLVDLARLRTGQLALAPRPAELGALVAEAVSEARERARATRGGRHRFRLAAPDELPPIVLDPLRIGQVLANLLDNAVAYSPGGADVTVTVRREGDGVAVVVRDRGQGLGPGEAEAIFAPFARAARAVVQEQPGLGLGLAICEGIVAQHGGRIGAESAGPGRGTTVTFWLPTAGPPKASDDRDDASGR